MSKKNNTDSPQLFDVQKAAEFLGVSAGTIRRWTHNQQLKGIKVGIRGDWRFTKDELFKMIQSNNVNLEVLQEQTIAQNNMLPRDNEWEIIREKPLSTNGLMLSDNRTLENTSRIMHAPRLDWRELNDSKHFVQFYENDLVLLDSLSKFLGIGLREGEFCIVVATETHRKSLEEKLKAYGLDLISAQIQGKYLPLDAAETLSKFMVDGLPDSQHFFKLIADTITRATTNGYHVRIFGEMVALLWAEGNQTGAIMLEKLWNDLGKIHSFSLYCAYPLHRFDKEIYSTPFTEIAKTHSGVIPAESYNDLTTNDERLRAIALLQQKAESLQSEIVKRKKLEKQKDEFISMASHELKSPITSLTAYTQLLEKRMRKKGDVQAANYLKRMEGQLEKLTNLVIDLLDVSKMQTGKMKFRKELFSIDSLLKETVEHVQITSQKHEIKISETVRAKVYGDRDRIGQIIINLLVNAIKYSPNSKEVYVYLKKEKKQVVIAVKDFGIGIEKEKQDKIFERFYRVSDTKENTYPGLGIGLYIAQQIVQTHNGQITVESNKGKGSIFRLFLPLASKNRLIPLFISKELL